MNAIPLRQPGIDHGRSLVYSPSEGTQHSVYEGSQLTIVRKHLITSKKAAATLKEDAAWAVYHDLGDFIVVKHGFKRTEPEHFIEQCLDQQISTERGHGRP